MALPRTGPYAPSVMFNQVLSNVHSQHFASASAHNEPRLVRALITDRTIRELNLAAASAYQSGSGLVFFRGGFLHGQPFARYRAGWKGGSKPCRRELADALIVVYVTQPTQPGSPPSIVARRACLLMFKPEGGVSVKLPGFHPVRDALPPDGDNTKEQFYLFNRWPKFDLQTGTRHKVEHGSYKISSRNMHDIGKYAVVRSNGTTSPWSEEAGPGATTTPWLFADPRPGLAISPTAIPPAGGSLGYLLQELIDQTPGFGRTFTPRPHQPNATNGWDELMGRLLGLPVTMNLTPSIVPWTLGHGTYYNESRDVNPANMQFVAMQPSPIEWCSVTQAELYQLAHDLGRPTRIDGNRMYLTEVLARVHRLRPALPDALSDDGLPVLIATVHHFHRHLDIKIE